LPYRRLPPKRTVTLLSSKHYLVSFRTDDKRIWESIKDKIKVIKSAIYIPETKKWRIDITPEDTELLQKYGFQFVGEAFLVAKGTSFPNRSVIHTPPIDSIDTKELSPHLRPYQVQDVQMLKGLHGLCLLSEPCGSGKSAIVASYLKLIPERPILIICPAMLKIHWQRELKHWAGLLSYICASTIPEIPDMQYDAYICNYDILKDWLKVLSKLKTRVVIVDECQYLINPSSLRSKSVKFLAKKAEQFIAVSATPSKSRARELWVVLNIIDPATFDNESAFKNWFCDPKEGFYGVTYDGTTHGEQLHTLISPFMIRRSKKEILPELPPINRIIIPMPLDNIDEYLYIKAEYDIAEAKEQRELEKKMYHKVFSLKSGGIVEWIANWLEMNPEESLVVAVYHIYALDILIAKFNKIALRIDGAVSSVKRQGIVDQFQQGKKRILFIQLIAGGVGVTLTKASNLVFAEMWYVPGDLEQTGERIHRIGTTAAQVNLYYLPGADTIEEGNIMKALDKKQEDVSIILDGEKRKYFEQGGMNNVPIL
jgi:SWI/SNF-related matrix-associated actin-dependent regulator 1 of chromatin subfamily A